MMFQFRWLKVVIWLTLFALVFSSFGISPAVAQIPVEDDSGLPTNAAPMRRPERIDKSEVDLNKTMRMIVKLADAPIASFGGEIAGYQPTSPSVTGAKKLDMTSASVKAYDSFLLAKQAEFKAALTAAIPDARIERSYRTVFNGMTVKLRMADAAALKALPGVAGVYAEKEYKLEMDASLPLIGLGSGEIGGTWTDEGLWEALGGHQNAGAGIKIADIDSGITPGNPCFDPTGFTYPEGFPKGETEYTTEKIISARAYFRPDDPPFYPATPIDDPMEVEGGHGTHTAGTMACNYGTDAGYAEISGVAPAAQLMVYRVFYYSVGFSHSAYTPEILAALEDALLDGADVINNSWGGGLYNSVDDPEVLAFEAATDAGVVIVFSAGNNGSGAMTLGNPGGSSEKFITVAASTTNRTFTTTLTIDSRSDSGVLPVPSTIQGASVTQDQVTAPFVDLEALGYTTAAAEACDGPLSSSDVDGKIVMVRRGTCALVDKVANAKAGGAVGVVIRNVPSGATTLPLINPVLPTIHIAQASGTALYTYLTGLPAGVVVTSTIHAPAVKSFGDPEDTLASFSSRGPTPDLQLKPDISAPGVNILSSVSAEGFDNDEATFDFYQGTSMAAPHVTGAAALMVQLHPTWTPAQIRSALMSTAVEPVSLGDNPTERGSGRLDLTEPDQVGLTFDHPSLSFGLMAENDYAQEIYVDILEVSGAETTYTVTVVAAAGGDVVTTDPVTFTLAANADQELVVEMDPATEGEAYGKVVLTPPDGSDLPTLHLPYYARVIDRTDLDQEVLLIDDDYSDDYTSCPDVLDVYTQTLTSLGYTYSVVTAGENWWDYATAQADWFKAMRHRNVLYFAGYCGDNLSWYENELRNYMAQGGRMLIMGQDIGYWDTEYKWYYGATFNPSIYFGGDYALDDVLAGSPTPWTAGGIGEFTPVMSSMVYGIDSITVLSSTLSVNTMVDEISPKYWSDADALPILGRCCLPGAADEGAMGTRMSYEPTIERVKGEQPAWPIPYRGLWVSFGLENLELAFQDYNFSTVQQARDDLAERLLNWLDAEVEVYPVYPGQMISSIESPQEIEAMPSTGRFFSNRADIAVEMLFYGMHYFGSYSLYQYRVDFGDGSEIQTYMAYDQPEWGVLAINHKYAEQGLYKGYVEVMDVYGHKAVTPFNVEVTHHYWFPFVHNALSVVP